MLDAIAPHNVVWGMWDAIYIVPHNEMTTDSWTEIIMTLNFGNVANVGLLADKVHKQGEHSDTPQHSYTTQSSPK